MAKAWIGIDNGVTGSVGVIYDDRPAEYFAMPTKTEQSYTKTAQNVTRIRVPDLQREIVRIKDSAVTIVALERPYVNPTGIKATLSAIRALEATLIVLEAAGLSFVYVDSRQWTKYLLPLGLKGTPELKKASLDIGRRLYPQVAAEHPKAKDFDGLLIAHWLKSNNGFF